MAKKLFVGGLPYSVTDEQLQEMFSKFGSILSASVITDRYSGQSKGFGFELADERTKKEIKNVYGIQ